MADPRRIEKLAVLLKEELAAVLDREIEFPEGALVTITRVHVSPDKRYATVFLSVLPNDPDPILDILNERVFDIQQILNKRVRMRPVPKIRFAADEEEERRERVEKSLAQMKRDGKL